MGARYLLRIMSGKSVAGKLNRSKTLWNQAVKWRFLVVIYGHLGVACAYSHGRSEGNTPEPAVHCQTVVKSNPDHTESF